MSNIKKLIRLYNELSELQSEEIEESTEQKISTNSSYFCTVLEKIFGDTVQVIHPNFNRRDYSTYERIWAYYSEKAADLKVVWRGSTVKPIVAIWKSDEFLDPPVGHFAQDHGHWNMMVLLPKDYTTCTNFPLKNQSEQVFLKYSEAKHQYLRVIKIMFLNNNLNVGSEVLVKLLMDRKYFETDCDIIDSIGSDDLGWWTIYAISMVLMKGIVVSLDKFTTKSKSALEIRIKAIIERFVINAVEKRNQAEATFKISFRHPTILYPTKEKNSIVGLESILTEIITRDQKYVDKSLFIKEIIDMQSESRIIITRPRRWGKILNMSLLYEFLSMNVDDEGNMQERNKAYDLFATGQYKNSRGETKFIEKLKITEINDGEYLKYQGQFPFIWIYFTSELDNSFNGDTPTYESIRSDIGRTYNNHKYIKRILERAIDTINFPDKRREIKKDLVTFNHYLLGEEYVDLENSIYFLSKLLHKYLNRKVYVVIIDYDAPLKTLNYGSKAYENAITLLSGMFFNAFKFRADEDFLEKVILTGVYNFPQKTLEPSLNNFTVCNILSPIFSDYYGFTEDEVNGLIDKGFVESPELNLRKKTIKDWYFGYRVGKFNQSNPWSIMNCLQSMRERKYNSIQCYWTGTGSTEKICKEIKKLSYSRELENLFTKGSVTLDDLNSIAPIDDEFRNEDRAIINLLVSTGFLTPGESENTYVLPNREMKKNFYRLFYKDWIESTLNIDNYTKTIDIATRLAKNLNNLPEYMRIFQKILSRYTDFKISKTKFRKLFCGIAMFTSFKKLSPTHVQCPEFSNKYLNKKVTLYKPIDKKSNEYILHQYKMVKSEIGIEEAMNNLVWQIYANKYLSVILRDMMPPIITVRAIVIYKHRLGSWLVRATEFKHNFDKAKRINKIFSTDIGSVIKQSDALSEKNIKEDELRIQFLKHRVSNIYDLIRRYSELESLKINDREEAIRKCQKLNEA